MHKTIKGDRCDAVAGRLGLAIMLAAFGSGALAQVTERYPDIHLTYRDLALDTPDGQRAFAERVEATATSHCARYATLIVPYHRRGQASYCVYAVRGEILRALPPSLRAAYDAGRSKGR